MLSTSLAPTQLHRFSRGRATRPAQKFSRELGLSASQPIREQQSIDFDQSASSIVARTRMWHSTLQGQSGTFELPSVGTCYVMRALGWSEDGRGGSVDRRSQPRPGCSQARVGSSLPSSTILPIPTIISTSTRAGKASKRVSQQSHPSQSACQANNNNGNLGEISKQQHHQQSNSTTNTMSSQLKTKVSHQPPLASSA